MATDPRRETLPDALVLGRKYAQQSGTSFKGDAEMFAFGASNVAAGLTGGFVLGVSASRTAAMWNSGARSQIPSLVAAGEVAVALLFFTGVLALLPSAALAGIVTNAVLSLIDVMQQYELLDCLEESRLFDINHAAALAFFQAQGHPVPAELTRVVDVG